jgi:DNA-binding MarR family transcriptional regulator
MTQDTQSSRENRRLRLLGQIEEVTRRNQQSADLLGARMGVFLGINHTDGRCVELLARLGRMSAGQLANETKLTTGAVTAIIDRLEASGYVQRVRDTLDRRKIWVELTPHMGALLESIFGVYDVIGPLMVRHFDDAQLAAILAFLRMGTLINEELAAGLHEHTTAGSGPDERVAQAKALRRAMEAMAPRIGAAIDRLVDDRS